MKKLIALLILFLFGISIQASDSTTIKSYGNDAIVLVKKGTAIKTFDIESSRQQSVIADRIATSTNSMASSLKEILHNFDYVISNAPPRSVINDISSKTGLSYEEISRSIGMKLQIYKFCTAIGIAICFLMTVFLIITFKSSWKLTIGLSAAIVAVAVILLLVLPYSINYLINTNYNYIQEVLSLSG